MNKSNDTDNTELGEIEKIFEDYRVLIMNGIGQGISFTDIAVASEAIAKRQINALISKARKDELKQLYTKLETGYAGGPFVLRATKIDERLKALTQTKEEE